MYFLGLGALVLLGNEQEIHDLGVRGGTPPFGELLCGQSSSARVTRKAGSSGALWMLVCLP